MTDLLTELLVSAQAAAIASAGIDGAEDSEDMCDALKSTFYAFAAAHPHLRDDSGPVICPDIRGVRCPAYQTVSGDRMNGDEWATDHWCQISLGEAPIGKPCPCVKDGQ